MTGPSENALAEAEAQALRDEHGRRAEERCVEAYLALDEFDPRRPHLNRVLAFLSWTERSRPIAAAA